MKPLSPWAIWTTVIMLAWAMLPGKIIPSPAAVVGALPRLWLEDGLGQDLLTSVILNLQAGVLMSLVSLLVAYSSVVPLLQPLSVIFSAGRFNSFVGLPLLLTIMIGNAHAIKLVLLAVAMSVFSVPAIVDIIHNIPAEKFEDARVLRMNPWRVTWEVVILGRIDEAIDVLRTNIGMGFMLLPMVEGLFRSEGGIGVLVLMENKYLRLDAVYCIVLVTMGVGLLQDRAIIWLKQTFCPYTFLDSK